MHPTHRYPGVQPFTTGQRHVFFGREQDTAELYRTLRREPLTVLYGKSGLGKSSLLNAGIIPECGKDGAYHPVTIRFGAWTEDVTDTPLGIAKKILLEGFDRPTFLDRLLPGDTSLWYCAKTRRLNTAQEEEGARPLLIFDQFEELFTYPEAEVRAFGEELAELLHTGIPLRFRRLAEAPGVLTEAEEDRLETPLEARILFAIRSDRMHLLHQLAGRLPNILRNLYELRALAPDDARRAIVQPAAAQGDFITPPFEWTPAALSTLLAFLQDPADNLHVEGILLQLLCQYFEEKKVEGLGLTRLDDADLGDLEQIVENYYFEKIASLGDPRSQLAARRLIEEGLVMEGENIRLSLHEAQISRQFNVDGDLLERLVNSRLLRAEPFLRGGYSYELAHDRLVAPILKAKRDRITEERRTAQETARLIKEQELAEAQRKRRRALLVAGVMGLLALAAGGVAVWAFSLKNKAQELTDVSNRQKTEIQNNLDALTKKEADLQTSLKTAQEAKDTAEMRRIEAELAKLKAAAERDNARFALAELASSNSLVAEMILENAAQDIYRLDYETALEKMKAAAGLEAIPRECAKAMLEIAFWHNEAGNKIRAAGILDSAALLMKNTAVPALLDVLPNDSAVARQRLRDAIQLLNKNTYARLQERYYPVMVTVEGGAFTMGCDPDIDPGCQEDEKQHQAEVNPFQLAKYETTWWQYFLFCRATGHEYEKPGWGTDGDNPAVNINWYDAVEYANWVSSQLGFEEAITKDTEDVYTVNLRSGYRLPTEAEWEYAAKGGKNKVKTIYSGSNEIDEVAWFRENSGNRTRRVGVKKANALGLYDMSGNVWEWCWDWYDENYPPQSEPEYLGPLNGDSRVVRGGSWLDLVYYCRPADRFWLHASLSTYGIGFRLARAQ